MHSGEGNERGIIWPPEPFSPDSALAIDRKRAAQSFRTEVDGL
jgi:hypothetical protein